MSGANALNAKQPPIQSTAGAVPIRNEKGICVKCIWLALIISMW